mgnify:CR=1 FL=1
MVIISNGERANSKLCIISAWLHDISLKEERELIKESIEDNHGIESSEMSRDFLVSLNLTLSEINEICDAINCHCFPNIQSTLTSKILWDSDKLNVFSREMEDDYLSNWTIRLGSMEKAKEQLTKERENYMKHFNTITAKNIARKLLTN